MNTPKDTYDLSVIIVNYNVAYFLDQCIDSVKRSLRTVSGEIIVVDNASKDDSLTLIKQHYPDVQLIENTENVGFSKANNQAIQVARGKWIVLLNPDTVVAEDTFEKCLEFVDNKEDCGAIGIRMINGKGEFLPESKRGLPTPLVAFYKLSGLSKLFSRSKRFNQYHAGHIDEHDSAPTPILSGAFMMIRKEALNKVGFLDEDFFMYGEDIDLSYRIELGGYRNYYFAGSSIIHYKGESTKKSSVNYVFVFYKAMVIFAKKHFGKKHAGIFSFIINTGIYLRAMIAIIARFVKRFFMPTIDVILLAAGMLVLSNYWERTGITFPETAFNVLIPCYSITWVVSALLNGWYDQPSILRALRASLLGTLTILVGYALLPKDWQFSRLFILIGTIWVMSYYLISRWYLSLFTGKKMRISKKSQKRFLIIGNERDAKEVSSILENSQVGILNITSTESLNSTIPINEVDEIIFCSGSHSYKDCIDQISALRSTGIEFKIAPKGRSYLIGSNSIDTAGDLYILEVNQLVNEENKRKKRFMDFMLSLSLLVLSPIVCLFFRNRSQFVRNIYSILIGQASFVGYTAEDILKDHRLPKTRRGILNPCDQYPFTTEDLCDKIRLLYARDYSLSKDFRIILAAFHLLDRK